jgi:membrane protein
MLQTLRKPFEVLSEAAKRWIGDACYRMSAALAFYALFSLFPVLLLAITVCGFVLRDDATSRARVLESFSTGSPGANALLDETLQSLQAHQTARGVSAFLGGVTLLFGAGGVFLELDASLNKIWRVKEAPSRSLSASILGVLGDNAFSFGLVVAAGALLLTSLLLGAVLDALGATALGLVGSSFFFSKSFQLARLAVSTGFLTAIFAAMFRVIPQCQVAWREVLGGALFTAVLFTVLQRILSFYLAHIGTYAAYGAIGGVLGLLLWIYLSSFAVFFGAELTRVVAERQRSARSAALRHVPCVGPAG